MGSKSREVIYGGRIIGASDAGAICEAVMRPLMRFVPIKNVEQQGALMRHRTGDLLIRQRTHLINSLRAHLAELGLD
jgi:transposase